MKKRIFSLALLSVSVPVAAHDFWIQPNRYQTADGAPVSATFQVGHGQFRQRWGNDVTRIPLLIDFHAGRKIDKRDGVRNGGNEDFVTVLNPPGIHILAMQTTTAFSNLPALRFNDYAKAEGLAAVIATRARLGTTNSPGRERYTRRAKALIQVGPQTAANSATATHRLGLKLEIVPMINPYTLGPSRKLPVTVFYKGRPLASSKVMLTNLAFDARALQTEITDAKGRATFTVPPVGDWLLNVLWSEPLNNDPQAEFDTTFSSLTFGYDPAHRAR